jgi:hypothetical protein
MFTLGIPAGTKLDRNGNIDFIGYGSYHLGDQGRCFHHGRSCAGLGNLGNRTAAVDVDDLRLEGHQLLERLFQRIRIAHEKLDGILLFIRGAVHQFQGFLSLTGKSFSAYHLGEGEICPLLNAEGPEWNIRISGQRCKKEIPLNLDISYVDRVK